jgi:uncharacterized protein YqcC (DUF446 family)
MLTALGDLELKLRAEERWLAKSPSDSQLSSIQPFCVDTLAFEQWLQWVFIPRMQLLASKQLPLPGGCHLQPMGEQSLAHLSQRQSELLEVLGRIDRLAFGLV